MPVAAEVQGSAASSNAGRFLIQQPADVYYNLLNALRKAKVHIWTDSLTLPVYVALISSFILVFHIVASRRPVRRLWRRLRRHFDIEDDAPSSIAPPPPREATYSAEIQERVRKHGGAVIFGFKLARLLGCIAFLALSIYSTALDEETRLGPNVIGKKKKKKKHPKDSTDLSQKEWQDLAICLTSLYLVLLSLVTVGNKRRWSKRAAWHLNAVLLTFVGVYGYRDIFPLAAFSRTPLDTSEGWLLWAKIAVLAIVAILIPLTMPRQYVPLKPEEPADVPNPEQTASILSLVTFSYLDPLVFLANRVPTLSSDQLPPLADYDHSVNLRSRAFPYLDAFASKRKRHVFFGLTRVFRADLFVIFLAVLLHVVAGFAAPIGVRNLLQYLETNGRGAALSPWIWVALLFLGPTVTSTAFQWCIFIASRTLVRVECIITQLIFEHSLRIRVKAETGDSPQVVSATAPATQASESIGGSANGGRPVSQDSEATLLHSSGITETTLGTAAPSEDHGPAESGDSIQNAKSTGGTKSPADAESKTPTDGSSNAKNLVGKINNLVTTDLENIAGAQNTLFLLISIPLQIPLCIVFLYYVLGWSALVGLAVMILLLPLPGYVARLTQGVQQDLLKRTDARVQTVSETMDVLRMVKVFGWERKMSERIAKKRDEELVYIWKRQLLDLVNGSLNYLIPIGTMIASYSTFVSGTLIMERELSASIVFSSMTVFDTLRTQLSSTFFIISQSINAKVSLDRVNDFLNNTELLDSYAVKPKNVRFAAPTDTSNEPAAKSPEPDKIGFHEASFTWSVDADGSLTPSKRKFVLRIEDELIFSLDKINLIVGPTGCGKTSLLMALLGEMHFVPLSPDSWFSLPRSQGVAYAVQESWVQNETIRQNILFGSPYDEERYNQVIHQCALTRDLALLEAGDQTEVGEKGLTLSGGQKARVTLARAIYSPAKILLLDDVLAALDVHTAKWVVEKCLAGDLVKGRTVILVTHNVALAKPIADFVVSLGSDGRILSQGSIKDGLKLDKRLIKELEADEELLQKADEKIETGAEDLSKPSDGQLIIAEEVEEGHVGWSALKLYFSGLGGKHPVLYSLAIGVGLILTEVAYTMQIWFLGYWAAQYTTHPQSEVPVAYYLGIYGAFLITADMAYNFTSVVYLLGNLRASRTLHGLLVESVLGATLRWLDTTPISRVITRCTQDISAVDGSIAMSLFILLQATLAIVFKLGVVVLLTPIFLFPGILVAVLGGICGQVYMAAQLPIKRELSNSKAPVLGHFGASIAGLTSLRAYGAQEAFKDESLRRINRYTRASRTFYNLNRWISIRVDTLSGLFAAGLAGYLLHYRTQGASNTGFSLNMAVGFSSQILGWIRWLNYFEVSGNSLERIQGYLSIEQEPKPTDEGVPPAYWPASGDLKVEGLSARYSADGPRVLHDITFDVKAGERIGIVGRTGSGKTSLTLALLRCILTEGRVLYDGKDTRTLNLDSLRSKITTIPQVPELLSGSLRQNLDPFEQYDDATLNDALRSSGLFSLQKEGEESQLTLDSQISSGGSNLSVGQRQILALARAIIRGSKLLILDEATSAIDHDTDTIIQSSLRNELGPDVSVITVAHRLQTIMDANKIMVLDDGRIVEFDKPSELLKDPNGRLRALVDESGDKERLLAMADFKF